MTARLAGGLLAGMLATTAVFTGPAAASTGGPSVSGPFITSAHENPDLTVTLPLHVGTSGGQKVYYKGDLARRGGFNTSQKLANARGSAAVQKVGLNPTAGSGGRPGRGADARPSDARHVRAAPGLVQPSRSAASTATAGPCGVRRDGW
jgi:hypothetical protein